MALHPSCVPLHPHHCSKCTAPPRKQAAQAHDVPYFYHEIFDAAWKGKLRGASSANASGGGGSPAQQHGGEPAAAQSAAGQGIALQVVADEFFGLVAADRVTHKGLVMPVGLGA